MSVTATKIRIPAITDAQYNILCGELRKLGFTLRSWSLDHGYEPATTYCSIRGRRKGAKALLIQEKMKDTLNVS